MRAWDPERLQLTLDFVVHGDRGVAGPWAAHAEPGDVLEIRGPGGGYAPSAEADWHLVGDDAALHRGSDAGNDHAPMLEAVRGLSLPEGRGHAFVHGEATAVRAVRRHLLLERGLPVEALSASGYWKRRRTDEQWRAEKREWMTEADADLAEAIAT